MLEQGLTFEEAWSLCERPTPDYAATLVAVGDFCWWAFYWFDTKKRLGHCLGIFFFLGEKMLVVEMRF